MRGSERGARTVLFAMTTAILAASGCGASTGSGGDAGSQDASQTTATATSTTTAAAYPTRRDLGMELDFQQRVFTIGGVTGAIPPGWEGAHIRPFYVFLGDNTAKQPPEFNWLTVVGPTWTGIGPPGPTPVLEPTPPDIAAQLEERGVTVTELGTLTVDGVQATVIQKVDGHLILCVREVLDGCRDGSPSRFYILIPGSDGELIIEGTSDLLSEPGAVTAEQAAPLITALQTWADTIDLP